MANPSCDRDALLLAAACYNGNVLDSKHQYALKVWFKVKQLAALGTTDYSSVLTTDLYRDAVNFARTTNSAERTAMGLAILKNQAVAAGATISSDINALMSSIACLVNVPEADLGAMDLLLNCQLGVHKSYPQ